MKDNLKQICKEIQDRNFFLIAPHVTPEGDAIGCALAMESLLRRLGKKTLIISEDPIPSRLSFFENKRWNVAKSLSKALTLEADALVTVDCPTLERIGHAREFIADNVSIFNIDHHISNKNFGHFNYVNPDAAACGEVVYDLFKAFQFIPDHDEALALYVAITTDTGSFKYSNTTIESHQITSALIQAGKLNIEEINDAVYGIYSLEKIRLYGLLLGRVETSECGRIAWGVLSREDLKKTGGTYEDSEGFIDFLKYLKNTHFAFFVSEMNGAYTGYVRVSLRAKGPYDVSQVALRLGGGGHRKASGCLIQGSVAEVTKKVLDEVKREYESQE
jgi:bifunctional oligoribonuclease and PAP phosphatase NrnA